ncbi:MAG: LysM domain-containing protein [Planctomycetota bacterium]
MHSTRLLRSSCRLLALGVLATTLLGCVQTPEPTPGTEWKRTIKPHADSPREPLPVEPLSQTWTPALPSETGGVLDVSDTPLPMFDPASPAAVATINVGTPGPRQHTVAAGETLYAISRTHLGDGRRWRDVVAINPGLDPTALVVGQTLMLP